MAGYTYAELVAAIIEFTDNDEAVFLSNVDNFIRNAEERLLKDASLEAFRKNSTAEMVVGSKYLPKPKDWLYSFALQITVNSNRTYLLQKDATFIQDYGSDDSDWGTPRFYSDFDVSNFIIAPIPDEAYTVELNYFYRPESIVVAADGKSWLGTNAGPALLYAALVEAYVFMKGEPDMIASYDNRYSVAIAGVQAFAEKAEGRDTFRVGTD